MEPTEKIRARLVDRMIRLQTRCGEAARRKSAVSEWCVGQHLEHVLKVNGNILRLMSIPFGNDPSVQPPTPEQLLILTNGIPRGKIKAPVIVQPTLTEYTGLKAAYEQQIAEYRMLSNRVAEIDASKGVFPHPGLGGLTRAQWLWFGEVHTAHHEKIVEEILAP
ncbi:MAG: DinB family protein [Planctomycetota bacterium]|nr:DinB family protein [Planctomycetota bacterium]